VLAVKLSEFDTILEQLNLIALAEYETRGKLVAYARRLEELKRPGFYCPKCECYECVRVRK
jgi:hypothetical protein